jgi:hypothetical protein
VILSCKFCPDTELLEGKHVITSNSWMYSDFLLCFTCPHPFRFLIKWVEKSIFNEKVGSSAGKIPVRGYVCECVVFTKNLHQQQRIGPICTVWALKIIW